MNGSQEEIIELGQEIVPEPVLKQEVIENIDPYISLKSVMADANQATVELTCLPQDLLKVLSLVDSLLVRDSALKECAKNH